MDRYDYIIVGAGASGCALAGTLALNLNILKDSKILVLESGRDITQEDLIKMHKNSGNIPGSGQGFEWKDQTVTQSKVNTPVVIFPQGKGFGGGSSVNGMLWARGHPDDYNSWIPNDKKDDPQWRRWSSENITNIFDAIEPTNIPVIKEPFPTQQTLTPAEDKPPLIIDEVSIVVRNTELQQLQYVPAKSFVNEVCTTKHPFKQNYLRDLTECVSYPIFNIAGNPGEHIRCDAYSIFLNGLAQVIHTPNSNSTTPKPVDNKPTRTGPIVHILEHAFVFDFICDDLKRDTADQFDLQRKITGVKFFDERSSREVYLTDRPNAQVILCAGAIRTPQILLLAGVGEGKNMKLNDSEVRLRLPKVGQNLRDHVATTVLAKVNTAKWIDSRIPELFTYKPTMLHQYLQSPIRLVNTTAVVVFFSLKNQSSKDNRPSFQLQSNTAQIVSVQPGKDQPDVGNYFGLAVIKLRPESKGSVTLESRFALDSPAINPNYLDNEDDFKGLCEATKEALELLRHENFKKWLDDPENPDITPDKDEDLEHYIRSNIASYAHFVGTCQMGEDPKDSVVGPNLKVWGFANLRIADASIIPSLPSANTNATAMMIGIQCAHLIITEVCSKHVSKL